MTDEESFLSNKQASYYLLRIKYIGNSTVSERSLGKRKRNTDPHISASIHNF